METLFERDGNNKERALSAIAQRSDRGSQSSAVYYRLEAGNLHSAAIVMHN